MQKINNLILIIIHIDKYPRFILIEVSSFRKEQMKKMSREKGK